MLTFKLSVSTFFFPWEAIRMFLLSVFRLFHIQSGVKVGLQLGVHETVYSCIIIY